MIIKICGIQNEKTLFCCEENRVNFFGLVFFSKSPRNISIERAQKLLKISEDLNINGVGVFVNNNIDEIKKIIQITNLKFVQLHGKEDDLFIKNLKKNNVKIIKSIPISNLNDLNKIEYYKNADYFLFDYKPTKGELPGGNAKTFDWNLVKNIKINKPWFLSGGINAENIKQIIKDINPFGIDLSSGVEKELGIKDNHIINNFIKKFNNA